MAVLINGLLNLLLMVVFSESRPKKSRFDIVTFSPIFIKIFALRAASSSFAAVMFSFTVNAFIIIDLRLNPKCQVLECFHAWLISYLSHPKT